MLFRHAIPGRFPGSSGTFENRDTSIYRTGRRVDTSDSAIVCNILGRVHLGAFGNGAEVTGTKIRSLFVTMALQANRTVSLERLTDVLWEGEPPRSAIANIRSFVHLLRGRLPAPARLASRAGGYELVVPEQACDHLRFVALAEAGRDARRRGDPARAAGLLGAALGHWQGDRAAVGVPRHGVLGGRLDHLDQERERVVEDLAEVYLELGETRAALRDLRELVAAAPARTRGWALCMRAYQMTGELDHVADVYRRAEAAYRQHLGVPVDRELREQYQRIMSAPAAAVIAEGQQQLHGSQA